MSGANLFQLGIGLETGAHEEDTARGGTARMPNIHVPGVGETLDIHGIELIEVPAHAPAANDQAIEALAQKYEAQGKTLQLRHLSRDCHQLLSRAGQLMLDSDDDPTYGVAVDYFVKTGSLGGGH